MDHRMMDMEARIKYLERQIDALPVMSIGGGVGTIATQVLVGGNNSWTIGSQTIYGLNGYPATPLDTLANRTQAQFAADYAARTAIGDGVVIARTYAGTGFITYGDYIYLASQVEDVNGVIQNDTRMSLGYAVPATTRRSVLVDDGAGGTVTVWLTWLA